MKKINLLLLFVLCSTCVGAWTYGSAENEWAYTSVRTSDGGFLVGGYYRNVYGEGLLVKTDAAMNEMWTRHFTDGVPTHNIELTQVIELDDHSGYLAMGTIFFNAERNLWLLRLNNSGDTVWTRQYDIALHLDGAYLEQTAPDEFVIGTVVTIPFSTSETFLMTMDSSAAMIDTIGHVDFEAHVINNPAGGYTFFGREDQTSPGTIHAVTDSYNVQFYDSSLSRQFAVNSGIYKNNELIVAGSTNYFTATGDTGQFLIMRINQNGDSVATNHWGNGFLKSVVQASANEIYLMGYDNDSLVSFLAKTDSAFNVVWKKYLYHRLFPADIFMSAYGYLTMYGDSMNDTLLTRDAWITFYDASGNVVIDPSTSIKENKSVHELNLFPNPCDKNITIGLPFSVADKPEVFVFDQPGKMFSVECDLYENKIKLHTEKLSSGMYHVKIGTDRGVFNGKFVVLR